MLLLGVEERELRLEADVGRLGASPHASKYAVRRVLINPGRRYRVMMQPPLLEVRGCAAPHATRGEVTKNRGARLLTQKYTHTTHIQTWGYVLAGNRHLAEEIQDLDIERQRRSMQRPRYQAVVSGASIGGACVYLYICGLVV